VAMRSRISRGSVEVSACMERAMCHTYPRRVCGLPTPLANLPDAHDTRQTTHAPPHTHT
jgi:hypothetical protein